MVKKMQKRIILYYSQILEPEIMKLIFKLNENKPFGCKIKIEDV